MRAALKHARRHHIADKTDAILAALRGEHLSQPPALTAAYAAAVRSLIAVITTLNEQVKTLQGQVEGHFGQHPDAEIYLSQPGMGAIVGARVLAEFGDDPYRYADARARKNYAATSPITRASGKKKLVEPVPRDVAAWLGVEPDQEVVIRKRLQLLDGVPAVISTSYYPLWVGEGTRLESADALPEGPDNLIEQLGHRFARGMELLQARMPTPDEVQMLELDPGVPVVRMLHIDYAPDGRTLQVADDLYAADRHEFAFEWTEPNGAPVDE